MLRPTEHTVELREGRYRRRGSAAKVILIVVAVFAVLFLSIGIYVAVSWRGWAATLAMAGIEQSIAKANLPDEQKDRVLARAQSLADDFKAGKLSMKQLGQIAEEMAHGPVLPMGMALGVESQYVGPSNLSDAEKEGGIRALQRLARGIAEKKIPLQEMQRVLQPVCEQTPGQAMRFKPAKDVPADDLRALLADAKKRADDAKVPDEPYRVDVAAAFDEAVKRVTEKGGGG
ncbi:MAG: hypothetical protein AB7G11_00705 [Phycisphaerales bacterium]